MESKINCDDRYSGAQVIHAPAELQKYTEANRAAWNEVMPLHQKAAREKWDRAFLQPGYVCLDDVEVEMLQCMGIRGKDVAQLCCNNGRELLSLKNLGAGTCVGFDVSDEAIAEARARAELCRIPCQFVRSDVYAIGPEWAGRFDVVYVSAGALGWIPDLRRFFAVAALLLQPGGHLFIHEIHPVAEMLPCDSPGLTDALRIVEPYFKAEPYVEYGGLDYVGHAEYSSTLPQYWFVHTLSDVIMSMIGSGLALEHFSEYPMDVSAGHHRVEQAHAGVPLSYILIGKMAGPARFDKRTAND